MIDWNIEASAQALASALTVFGQTSRNEEELRIHSINEINRVTRNAGLELEARHEYALGKGRADSLYGSVVIEFEAPRSLGDDNARRINRHAIAQAQEYATRLSSQDGYPLNRILGVVTDGQYLIFLSHRRSDWEVSRPRPIDESSVTFLLSCLRALRARALVAENLVQDFTAKTEIAKRTITALYMALDRTTNPKVDALYRQWRLLFSEVCEYERNSPRLDVAGLARHFDLELSDPDATKLFFCVHSYYATLIKLLAAEIVTFFSANYPLSYLGRLEALSSSPLRAELRDMEEGGIFRQLGIRNFLEGDFFAWYLDAWDSGIFRALSGIVAQLRSYDPATARVAPDDARDLLKNLYQNLLPEKWRHDLGEYYTPDWLADFVLDEVGYKGDLTTRILDPTCGSGTFLVLEIRRAIKWGEDHFIPGRDVLDKILDGIVGFDMNPLAVIAARTNYLLALGDLLRYRTGDFELPVYLCDSIMTPREPTQQELGGRRLGLATVVANFDIPLSLGTRDGIFVLTAALEQAVKNGYSWEDFLARLEGDASLTRGDLGDSEGVLSGLYSTLVRLNREGKNGIWPRIIKNFFAPMFVGQFDFVAGNPPWVNWENLPDHYRASMKPLWIDYGLFTLKGFRARMGGGKKDLSALCVYVSADKYLKNGGTLGFVITETVFSSSSAGAGFRRFRIPGVERPTELRVLRVHDLVQINPFDSATNRTAVMTLQKGQATRYPVQYVLWERQQGKSVSEDMSLAEVRAVTRLTVDDANPISGKIGDPWTTGSTSLLKVLKKAVSRAAYTAHEGLNVGGASGVYWVELLDRLPGKKLLVQSLPSEGKNKDIRAIGSVRHAIERELIFPLLRGRDVRRWRCSPGTLMILPHDIETGQVYEESTVKVRYPEGFDYLRKFKHILLGRKASQYKNVLKNGARPFYWICNVIVNHRLPAISTWKVVWPELSATLEPAVCGPLILNEQGNAVPILADHTVVCVQCKDEAEAHFVCAVLSSTPSRLIVESYVHLHASPHVLDYVGLPKFDQDNQTHVALSELSKSAHKAAVDGTGALRKIEWEIDLKAAEIWSLSPQDLELLRLQAGP